MQTIEQQLPLITEEKIIAPLEIVLNEVTPKTTPQTPQTLNSTQAVKQCLDDLFPEQRYEEKDIQRTKEILGELANKYSPEQLKGTIIEIQHLAQTWLDDFERDIFKGLTLKEILHEKGGI